jgi:glutamine synthetase
MFIGDELEAIVESIIEGTDYHDKKKKKRSIGAEVLPSISQDTTDRNRTSPFAFTGNKFEFRSLGSSASISGPNVILNTIVAEELEQFADELEGKKDFCKALNALIKRELTAHQRIIFNGNGYSEDWVKEAKKRGLANLKSTVDALPAFVDKKSIDVFTKHNVFTEQEILSRYDIQLENYYKVIDIEALTMDAMVKKDIMAAATDYQYTLAETLNAKAATGLKIDSSVEKKHLERASKLTYEMDARLEKLEEDIKKAEKLSDTFELAKYHHDVIFADMNELREVVDELETLVPSDIWPYPTYGEILYSVK